MNRQSKNRRQGDPVQTPGNLADQINQDRSVVLNKKPRQKQKRKLDDEEEDEQVRRDPLALRTTAGLSLDHRRSTLETDHPASSRATERVRQRRTACHQPRGRVSNSIRPSGVRRVIIFHLAIQSRSKRSTGSRRIARKTATRKISLRTRTTSTTRKSR